MAVGIDTEALLSGLNSGGPMRANETEADWLRRVASLPPLLDILKVWGVGGGEGEG